MDLLKWISKYWGVIGFSAMTLVIVFILLARIQLGYLPVYGLKPRPEVFGYKPLYIPGILLFYIAIPTSVIWFFATITGMLNYGKAFKINHVTTLLLSSAL